MEDNNSPKSQMTRYVIYGVGFTIIMLLLAAFVSQLIAVNTVKGKLAVSEKRASALEGELEEKNAAFDAMKVSHDEALTENDKLRTELETLKQQFTDMGMQLLKDSISGNSVSENSVSENAVSENEVSENEVSENEVMENEVPENEVPENEVSENKITEDTVSENKAAEEAVLKNEVLENETPKNEVQDNPALENKTSSHSFTDKNGMSVTFTADEWNYLINVWAYTGEPEDMIASHTVAELKTVLAAR